jgi:hypothetical protein
VLDFDRWISAPVTDESAYQFLRRRQGELTARAAALRGQLRPIETELAQIEKMLSVAPAPSNETVSTTLPARNASSPTDYVSALKPFLELETQIQEAIKSLTIPTEEIEKIQRSFDELIPSQEVLQKAIESAADFMTPLHRISDKHHSKYEQMTIKELVIQALVDHFPEGARANDIRKFIKEGYGRDVEQASFRPQLHRLKTDEILFFRPETETWNLHQRKRQLYGMYNHPTSRAAMKELKDDPPEGSARRTIAGGAGSDN